MKDFETLKFVHKWKTVFPVKLYLQYMNVAAVDGKVKVNVMVVIRPKGTWLIVLILVQKKGDVMLM